MKESSPVDACLKWVLDIVDPEKGVSVASTQIEERQNTETMPTKSSLANGWFWRVTCRNLGELGRLMHEGKAQSQQDNNSIHGRCVSAVP